MHSFHLLIINISYVFNVAIQTIMLHNGKMISCPKKKGGGGSLLRTLWAYISFQTVWQQAQERTFLLWALQPTNNNPPTVLGVSLKRILVNHSFHQNRKIFKCHQSSFHSYPFAPMWNPYIQLPSALISHLSHHNFNVNQVMLELIFVWRSLIINGAKEEFLIQSLLLI